MTPLDLSWLTYEAEPVLVPKRTEAAPPVACVSNAVPPYGGDSHPDWFTLYRVMTKSQCRRRTSTRHLSDVEVNRQQPLEATLSDLVREQLLKEIDLCGLPLYGLPPSGTASLNGRQASKLLDTHALSPAWPLWRLIRVSDSGIDPGPDR